MASKTLKKQADKNLVPYTGKTPDGYPQLFKALTPDGTHFKVDPKTGSVQALVTVAPGGTKVAWDNCGQCHNHISHCKCVRGITAPRSIEYIVDASAAIQAGEAWDMTHPNYRGSLRAALRVRAGTTAGGLRAPLTVASATGGTPAPRKPASAPAAPTGAPRRLLRKPTTPAPAPTTMPDEAHDRAKMDRAASSSADDIVASMTKRLLKKPTGQPVRKVLKKRTDS